MKKLLIVSLVGLVTFIPQLHSISLTEYIKQNGMPKIRYNGISGNCLYLLDRNLTDITGLDSIAGINQVHLLSLSNNQLQTLPATIFSSLHNLRELYLQNNQLQELPDNIFKDLHNMAKLYIYGNSFDPLFMQNLRRMIADMPCLEILNGKPKDEALKEAPFCSLKQVTAEYLVQNLEPEQLEQLEPHILDLLPLSQEIRTKIAEKQATQQVD